MRSLLMRSEKGVANGATITFIAGLEGQRALNLQIDNFDQKAGLIMQTGGSSTGSNSPATLAQARRTHYGKNGCLKFEAVLAGVAGDQAIAQAWSVDDTPADTAFVDETADIASAGANDVAYFPATENIGDYFAVGGVQKFGTVRFNTGTSGVGGVVAWEYWNGSAWAALAGVVDNTAGFTAAPGFQNLTFTVPTDWAKRVINASASLYYIRARVTTVYSTNPLGTQGFFGSVGGNSNTIEITCGVANQAFSITDPGANAWRINLKCGPDGSPQQSANQVMAAIAADTTGAGIAFRSAVNVTLAPGSGGDGALVPLLADPTRVIPAATAFAGGAIATTTAAGALVDLSLVGVDGPWVNDATASTALSSVANNTSKATLLTDKPAKAVRVSIVGGGTATWVGFNLTQVPV